MPHPLTRKSAWSAERWRDFGRRCQAVRDRYDELIRTLPETRGLTPRPINRLIRGYDRLYKAMVGAESVFAAQYPDRNFEAIGVIHGAGGAFLAPCRGRVPASVPILSREEWIALGRTVKDLRDDITALGMELQETARASKPTVKRFLDASELGDARTDLDALVCRQHPGWAGATRVFYGSGPVEPDDDRWA